MLRNSDANKDSEYITQLEAEIANKVTENGDLRAHNRALVDENKRLSDLTRMLLGSPSFSDFLERLSTNPSQLPSGPQVDQSQMNRQAPKDVNPYAAHQQVQRQSVGVAMVPEQNMDFAAFGDFHQPQVFVVLETPEPPTAIDTAALAGKESNFVGQSFESDDEKVEMPAIEQLPVMKEKATAPKVIETPITVDEDFENDPDFALYHESSPAVSTDSTAPEFDIEESSEDEIFGGIQSEKFLARYELLDASTEEQNVALAMASVQRRFASLEGLCSRLEVLTADM